MSMIGFTKAQPMVAATSAPPKRQHHHHDHTAIDQHHHRKHDRTPKDTSKPGSEYWTTIATDMKKKRKKTIPTDDMQSKYWSSRSYLELLLLLLFAVALFAFLALFVLYYTKWQKLDTSSGGSGNPTNPGGGLGSTIAPTTAQSILNGIGLTPLTYNNAYLNVDGTPVSPHLAPILGWNSWESFHFDITEPNFQTELQALQSTGLQAAGYVLAVIDDRWMCATSAVTDTQPRPITQVDVHGFSQPDPVKFPSSMTHNGSTMLGFGPLSSYAHSLGFQFGIHIITGVSQKAYNLNYQIPGTTQTTQTIIQGTSHQCQWCSSPYNFYYLDPTNPAAQIWLNMMFEQYATWGVDYVKVDCIFGWNFNDTANTDLMTEMYRTAALASGRNIAVALSPGSSLMYTITSNDKVPYNQQYAFAAPIANTYRATVDLWPQEWLGTNQYNSLSYSENTDTNQWSMVYVLSYFMPASYAYAGHVMTGSNDLSFCDYDMIPAAGVVLTNNEFYSGTGPTAFTVPQQQTIFAAWAMIRSPIILGGDVRTPDPVGIALATNPYMLFVNQYSTNLSFVSNDHNGNVVMTAERQDVGLYFALSTNMNNYTLSFGLQGPSLFGFYVCDIYDIWNNITHTQVNSIISPVPAYGCLFVQLSNCR